MDHVAIDLGGKESQICVRSSDGNVIEERRCATKLLPRYLAKRPKSRVIVETCAEAFFVADAARSQGHEVRVVPATLVTTLGVGSRRTKNDRKDAQVLSEVSCRIDLPSVHVPSMESRDRKTACGMRESQVGARTQLINTVRGWLRRHPQETSENSVDIGHLSLVHGYLRVDTLRTARGDGAHLDARYTMSRRIGFASIGPLLRSEFEVHLHGLGYSFVEVMTDVGLVLRQFVLSTPTEPGLIDLRIACAVKAPRLAPRLGMLDPGRLVAAAANRGIISAYVRDVGQDLDIWRHKRYVHPPALAEGDGPVGLYRRWASQFYSAPPSD